MQITLSDSAILRLAPAKKGMRYEVKDAVTPGLILRVGSLKKTFYLYVKVAGCQVRIRLGDFTVLTTDQARVAASRELLALTTDGPARSRKALTLKDAFDEYLSVRSLRQDSIDSYKKIVRLYLSDFMPLPIADVTPTMCLERYIKLRDAKSPSKANDALRVLRAGLCRHTEHSLARPLPATVCYRGQHPGLR